MEFTGAQEIIIRFIFVTVSTTLAFFAFNAIALKLGVRRCFEKTNRPEPKKSPDADEKPRPVPQKKPRKQRVPAVTIKYLNENKIAPESDGLIAGAVQLFSASIIFQANYEHGGSRIVLSFPSGKGFRYAEFDHFLAEWIPVSVHPVTGKKVLPVHESWPETGGSDD